MAGRFVQFRTKWYAVKTWGGGLARARVAIPFVVLLLPIEDWSNGVNATAPCRPEPWTE
jgi:hypothetical protein